MVQFNYRSIMQKIAASPSGKKRIMANADRRFASAKELLLLDFDDHPVTREIKDGPLTDNISDTLNSNADLFSFIGFEAGSSPTDALRNVLETEIVLRPPIVKNVAARQIFLEFKVREPSASIRKATPMPWESGKSWAEGIEEGIRGFGSFMRAFFAQPSSRSGGGIQTKNQVRNADFKPRPYLTGIFEKLAAAFRRRR